MRGAIVGSSLVHLVLLVALLAVRHGGSVVIAGPDVVQVALLDPVAPAAAPAPPPAPAPPAPKLPDVKPADEKGVRAAPPPTKKKPAEAQEEPPPPARPYTAAGNAGLRRQVAVG